jgi:hypothetical protein
LIDPADAGRARDAAFALGYRARPAGPDGNGVHFDGSDRERCADHLPALLSPNGIALELHLRGSQAWRRDRAHLERDARVVQVLGSNVRLPSRIDLAIHLSRHVLIQHGAVARYLPRHMVDLQLIGAIGATLDLTLALSRLLLAAAAARPGSPARRAAESLLFPTSRDLKMESLLRPAYQASTLEGYDARAWLRRLFPARAYMTTLFPEAAAAPPWRLAALHARRFTRPFGRASTAVELHGVRIAWSADRDGDALVRRLLAGLPEREAVRDAEVTIRLRRATAPADTRGFRPTFHHFGLRALERTGEFLLLEGGSHVRVSSDGRRIDARYADGAPRSFVDVTLFAALALALRHHGLYHLHAGALERGDGRRILVMGGSGAGKTTVTLSLLDPDSRFLGDDALFLAERAGRACLIAFPRPFRLGEATRRAFPRLPAGPPDAVGKRAVALSALPGAGVSAMDAPALVLFPEVTSNATTQTLRLDAGDAFGRALSAGALAVVDGAANVGAQLALLRRLLEGAAAYELRLGADWLAAPGAPMLRAVL